MGGDHDDDGHCVATGHFADALACLPAIHPGHLEVHEDGIKWRLRGHRTFPHGSHGQVCTGGGFHRPAQGLNGVAQHVARDAVVVDDQNVEIARHGGGRGSWRWLVLHFSQWEPDLKMEGTPLAQRAVDGQGAAQQTHHPAGNRQTQPGAAIAARGRRLGLRKAAEDVGLVFRRNADAAVFHGKFHQHAVGVALHNAQAQHRSAGTGELDGVAAQVDQHLLQTHIVSQQALGQDRVDIKQHFNVLGAHIGRKNDRQVAHEPFDLERTGVQRHLAGLDLGKIKDVVEQPQQRARRALGLGGVIQLAHGEVCVLQ